MAQFFNDKFSSSKVGIHIHSIKTLGITFAFASLGLVGCMSVPSTPKAPTEQVQVYKSLGGKQCESSGHDVSEFKQQLESNQIRVYAHKAGQDGMMYPQMCGGPNGQIGIYHIAKAQLSKAQGLGFSPYTAQQ